MRWLAIVCLVAACHPETKVSVAEPRGARPGDPIAAGGGPTVATRVIAPEPEPPEPAASVGGRRRGAPHAAQIVAVVASAKGDRVLSRDAIGGVRVWATLDGTIEPQALPVRAPEAMAIAARADGSLAALIDATGTLLLYRVDGEGLVRSTVTVPPDVPFKGVAVLDGGERVVAVRGDHRILLLDADGKELSRLGVRGARLVALHPAGDGLVAVLRKSEDSASYEVRRLALAGDGLAWTGATRALADPVATLPHVASAVSPDGTLLAYLAQVKNAPQVRIVDVTTGADIPLDGPATTTAPAATMIGWTGDRRVEMAAFGGNGWRIDVDGKQAVALSSAVATGTSTAAFAPGLRITGYNAHLALSESDGDVFYLGHRELYPNSGALAPDGTSAAWVTSTGALVIQRFDGSPDVRIKNATDYFGYVSIVDDGHVLAGRSNGQLVLFDSRTGDEKAAMVASASTPWFHYEPKTKLAAVMRDAGVVWLIPIDSAAAQPLGTPVAVNDAASNFTLLDPDLTGGAALMTFDATQQQRSYSLDEISDGLSAAEMKKERVATGAGAWAFDRRGRQYVVSGTSIEIRDGAKAVLTRKIDNGIHGVFPAPRGDRMVVIAANAHGVTTAHALDDGGTELWSVSSPRGVFSASWAADSSRVIVSASGGSIVVDGKTGKRVIASSGWAFARSTELPNASPAGAEAEFATP